MYGREQVELFLIGLEEGMSALETSRLVELGGPSHRLEESLMLGKSGR